MLYKKKNEPTLSETLFKNPTSEYRGAPFWGWNCKTDKDELLRQIDCLKEMGFGGFHIHSRSGMDVEYLGKDFMDLVKSCTNKAEENDMLTYLYDEDRWPSGYGGGFVTKTIAHRQKRVRFTVTPIESGSKEDFIKTGKAHLLSCFDIVLDNDGYLVSYDMIDSQSSATGTKWYAYMEIPKPLGRFNNQTYVDTMSHDAIKCFIDITHEGYKNVVGDKFGNTINCIFTDEPQLTHKEHKKFSTDKEDSILPWTYDFDVTYKEKYNDDIIPHLPELVWELKSNVPSLTRYRYHDHACERITSAFLDQCGEWCDNNGIMLSGHVMGEGTLYTQTRVLGEAMRTYRSFGMPGIDILCNHREYATAKQCQSIVHQYGREGMLSELYGVTGWKYDFRGHKFQGDWQAACGVTLRVPHHSLVSLKGAAKRDYPASINYQSPWYKEYSYIENHFARLNTALTRGIPIVKVGVIHPIESMWLHYGPQDLTNDVCTELDRNFNRLIECLLFGTIDFDFISESLIPDLYEPSDNESLHIGHMNYDTIIVPNMITMRSTTLEILKNFKERGGKLIFIGKCPKFVDAVLSDDVKELYESSITVCSASLELLDKLQSERFITIHDDNGKLSDNLIYTLRKDTDSYYLFIAHGKPDENPDIPSPQSIKIKIKDTYRPLLFDTLSGNIFCIPHYTANGYTYIEYKLYNNDSLLLKLIPADNSSYKAELLEKKPIYSINYKKPVKYQREEPNVLILDLAEYSLDGIKFEPMEELLRIDEILRKKLDFPSASGMDVQPWYLPDEINTDFVYLKFTFESEFEAECLLAYEELESITLNGKSVAIEKSGHYVDVNILTTPLPKIKVGKNELILKAPIGKRTSLENYMLLGDFNVLISGCKALIKESNDNIGFGTITNQGMPFYGGNITYETKIVTPKCNLKIRMGQYKGALVRVAVDNADLGPIAFAPYEKEIMCLDEGEHTVKFTLFGNRNNTFSALHNCNPNLTWFNPRAWYSEDYEWSYEYKLEENGIITSPIIEVFPL